MDSPARESAASPAVRAVAALGNGLRHQVYAFIRGARCPVTRDQAAAAATAWRGNAKGAL